MRLKIFITAILIAISVKSFAQQTETVCDISNLPKGWVVSEVITGRFCGANSESGFKYVIMKIDEFPVGKILYVCKKDKLPEGWIVTNSSNCFCCGSNSDSGWRYTIKRIK